MLGFAAHSVFVELHFLTPSPSCLKGDLEMCSCKPNAQQAFAQLPIKM